jgi:hypothetical protein
LPATVNPEKPGTVESFGTISGKMLLSLKAHTVWPRRLNVNSANAGRGIFTHHCFLSKNVSFCGAAQRIPRWEYRNSKKKTLHIRGTIKVAGELDDRWPGSRKRAGREESPDTTSRE